MLSFARNGTCRRATRTCSRSARKQASRAALRPGPARRHPQEINLAQGASLAGRLLQFWVGRDGQATFSRRNPAWNFGIDSRMRKSCLSLFETLGTAGQKDYSRCVRISLQVWTRWTFGCVRG